MFSFSLNFIAQSSETSKTASAYRLKKIKMVCRARVPCLESWPRRCDHITEELLNRH